MYLLFLLICLFVSCMLFPLIKYDKSNSSYSSYALYIPERFVHLKKEVEKTGLDVNYVLGYDKNQIDMEILKENHENTGKVACHMGHLLVMKKFLEGDSDYAVIFEDDIVFEDHTNIKPKIEFILDKSPRDADIIFLSYCFEDCRKNNNKRMFNKANRALCRHAYIVSRRGAQKIIENTWPMKNKAGDEMYSSLLRKRHLNGYTIKNDFISIEQNRLNLGSKLGNYASARPPPKCLKY